MPKAIKKRISKKSDAPVEEVQEKLSTLKDTLQQRQSIALKIGLGILLIIAAVLFFLIYSHNAASKAAKHEHEAYRIFYSKGPLQTENKQEQYSKSLEVFKKAYDAKKSPFSLYYIASCYYELGQYDESLKTLQDFVRRYSGESQFLPLAYRKMVIIHLRKGDTNEAKKALDALYGLKSDVLKDYALIEYGRLLEKEGNTEEAKKKYEELITRFPASPFKDEAQMKASVKKEG